VAAPRTASGALTVLHVVPYAGEAWAYGGIARVAAVQARALAARGVAVTVCTTDACDATSRLASSADPIEPRVVGERATAERSPANSVRTVSFPNVSNRLAYHLQLFTPRGMAAWLRRHAASFDLAHLHGCHHLPGVWAARELRRAGVPYLVQPNGTAPRIERRRAAKWLFDHTVGRGVLPGASRVIAVSAAEERDLLALGVAPERLSRLPNPLDEEGLDLPLERGFLRQRWSLGDAPVVLYLGALSPRKGLDVLVDAVARLPGEDVRLVLAGNDRGVAGDLRERLRARGLERRTVFAGLLRGRDRYLALHDADVVAYATRQEAFGLVPLEALLAGTPVVVAGDHGCGEVIGEIGGGRVVTAGDPEGLASALAATLADPAGSRELARAAAPRARASFGAAGVAAALEAIYRSVLAGGVTAAGPPPSPARRGGS
jgi:glycosyltransferase involved in cell wall biosynthesis